MTESSISPLIVRVGEGHIEIGIDGVERVSHEQDGFVAVEWPVSHPFRIVRLDDFHAVVGNALSLRARIAKAKLDCYFERYPKIGKGRASLLLKYRFADTAHFYRVAS